jgi:hypothetical protein
MRKLSFIAILGATAVLTGGCDALSFLPGVGGGDDTAVIEPTPVPQADPSPTPQEGFEEPTEEGVTVPAAPSASLIPATNPQERLQAIAQSRPDPFSAIPTTPLSAEPPQLDGNGQAIPGGQGGGAQGGGAQGAPGTTAQGQPQEPGQAIQSVPPLPEIPQPPRIVDSSPVPRPGQTDGNGDPIAVGPDFLPNLPPLPQPTLAEGVNVTGVIQVNGVPHAIVEAPGQQSRYVKQGDFLANGRVLVKRIEVNRGRTPVVVLEQAGIEVAKRVGEGGTPNGMEGSESASTFNGDRPRG